MSSDLEILPVDNSRWADLRALFGERGATEGCWCMYWRRQRAEYQRSRGKRNQRALGDLCTRAVAPGLLAYIAGEPVGWCAVAPREQYARLARARTLAPIDDLEVWSVPCFFVDRHHRRSGVASALLGGAVDYGSVAQ